MFCNSLTSFAQWEQVAPPDATTISSFSQGDSLYFMALNGQMYKIKNSVDSLKILKNNPWLNSIQIMDNILYGVSGPNVYSSNDDGKTWTNNPVAGVGSGLQLLNLIIEENNLYINDYQHFAYSDDKGITWKLPESGFPDDGLMVMTAFGKNVIIKGWGSDYYISNDGGKNFSKKYSNFGGYIEKFLRSNNTIYALQMDGSIGYSTDTCKYWKTIYAPNTKKIVSFYLDSNRLYIRTFGDNIFYTENNGMQWTDTGLNSNYDVIGDANKDIIVAESVIYINTVKGWLKANPDKNQTYTLLNKNLLPRKCIYISNVDDQIIMSDNKNILYNNDDQNFKVLNFANYFYNVFKIDNSSFGLWESSANEYYKTVDNGNTFSKIPTKMKYDVWVYSGIKTSDYILFIKYNKKSLIRYDYVNNDTMNLSFPWSFDNINSINAIAVKNNVFVVAGSVDKFSISNDFGNTWTHTGINFSSGYGSITSMTFDNNRLIAYTSKGYLCYSTDNGLTWTEFSNHSLIPKNFSITKLVNKGKFIVVGGSNGLNFNNAVYSVDGGETFKLIINELKILYYPENNYEILSFTSSDKYLWVGTTKGVFRYDISEFTSGIFEINTPETDKPEFTISPNPVIDQLSITTSEKANYRYSIYSVTGVKILSGKFIENTDVDLNHFDPGLYYLTIIKNEYISSTQKFIKM